MKLQWSIQSSHIQLVLSQVVYLNYRNEHIWPPTMITYDEAFHLASLQFITFDHFESIHLILRFTFFFFWALKAKKNNNKRVGRDIGTSLRMYQNQHDYLLIIHDKLERSIYNNHTKMSRFFPQRYKCKNNKLSL